MRYLFHLLLPCPLIRPCPALPAITSWAHRRRQQQPPQRAARKARGPDAAMGAGGPGLGVGGPDSWCGASFLDSTRRACQSETWAMGAWSDRGVVSGCDR